MGSDDTVLGCNGHSVTVAITGDVIFFKLVFGYFSLFVVPKSRYLVFLC